MGSLFRVPLLEVLQIDEYLLQMKKLGIRTYALSPRAPISLFDVKPIYPSLIVLGSESRGVPESLPVDERISIPMAGKVESLNVAMAAAVCFYWFSREVRA